MSKYHLKQHFCLLWEQENVLLVTHIYSVHQHLLWLKTYLLHFPVQCFFFFFTFFILLSAIYIWPGPKDNCFSKSKSTAPWPRPIPWTLSAADVHATVKRNFVLMIDWDVDTICIGIFVSFFFQSLPYIVAWWNGLQLLPLNQLLDQKTQISFKLYFEQCYNEQRSLLDH